MSILPIPVEDDVDEIISNLDLIFDEPSTASAPTNTPEIPSREILVVTKVIYFSGGYIDVIPGSKPKSQAYIQLEGYPSPSSNVTKGYIRFVPAAELHTPVYQPERKLIQMWVDKNTMAQTLEQLRHSELYFWIGYFDGGHIYADIHSRP